MIRKDIPPSAPLPESNPDGSGDGLVTAEDLFGDLVDAPLPVETQRPAPARPGPVRVQVAEAGALESEPRTNVKKAAKPSDIPTEELAQLLDAFAPEAPPPAAPPEARPDEVELLLDTMAGPGGTKAAVDRLLEELAPKPSAPHKSQDLSDLLEGIAATSEPATPAPAPIDVMPATGALPADPTTSEPALAAEPEPQPQTEADATIPEPATPAEAPVSTSTSEAPTEVGDLDALMEASLARGTHPQEIDQLLEGFDALPSVEGEAPTASRSGARFHAAEPQVAPLAETRPDLDLAAVADEALSSSRPAPQAKPAAGSGRTPVEGSYGPYRLLERVALGGMAEVFKAKRSGVEGFEKVVAVKRILSHLSDNKEFVEMFIGEAKIVAGLTHPNVVQIFDLGKIDKSYYIAMEYIHGRDLRSILKRAKEKGLRLPLDLSVLIVAKVCSALEYAHRKKDESGRSMKIVHRDISPQNILISFEGEVKLADFGIAKAASSAAITDRGVLRGKLLYMSPEQAWGQSMDRRSDIFSLGVVFYEMVTDTKLFMGTSERGILETVRECHVVPPTTLNPRIPERLEAVIMKALDKDPEQRYQDASEMYRDLERVLHQRQPPTAVELARFMEILFDDDQRGELEPDEHGSGEDRPRAGSLEIDLDPGSAAPAPGPSGNAAPPPERNDSGINRLLKRFGIK